jgi:hypothetical protein
MRSKEGGRHRRSRLADGNQGHRPRRQEAGIRRIGQRVGDQTASIGCRNAGLNDRQEIATKSREGIQCVFLGSDRADAPVTTSN